MKKTSFTIHLKFTELLNLAICGVGIGKFSELSFLEKYPETKKNCKLMFVFEVPILILNLDFFATHTINKTLAFIILRKTEIRASLLKNQWL